MPENKDQYPIDAGGHPVTNGLFPTEVATFETLDAAGAEQRIAAPQAGILKKIVVNRTAGNAALSTVKLRMKKGSDAVNSLIVATAGISSFPNATVVEIPYGGGAEIDYLYVFVDPVASGSTYTVQFLIEKRVELNVAR